MRWRQRDYAASAFPDLATAVLERADEVEGISTQDILRWIAREPALPAQQDARSDFSDLAMTFYETPRFFVSTLMWLDGTTTIHQHSFSGAFRVLAGGSLHTRYRFHETRHVNDHFRLGTLEREEATLLPAGSVRPIRSGGEFIHSLFHLERPSVTLVIRTKRDEGARPQWSYCAPGIAFDQILSTLFQQVAANPLKRALGAETGERFERLLGAGRKRHGAAIDLFEQAFAEQRRQHEIIETRRSVTSSEHRFLLALLLNVPDRTAVLELIAQRYPDRDPVDAFVDWIEELSRTRELGSLAPNVLRIPDFGPEYLVVLGRLLRGGSMEDAASDLCDTLPTEDLGSSREATAWIVATLRNASFLRAIIREV